MVWTAFLTWAAVGLCFFGLGLYQICGHHKKAFHFWANVKPFPVSDIKAYNRAVGNLWCGYGLFFILLGLPLLSGQTAAVLLLSILGTVFSALGLMLVYVLRIEPKYKADGK